MTARQAWRDDFDEHLRILADIVPDEHEELRATLVRTVNDLMAEHIDDWNWPSSE